MILHSVVVIIAAVIILKGIWIFSFSLISEKDITSTSSTLDHPETESSCGYVTEELIITTRKHK